MSLLALFLSSRAADAQYSFGYHRAEVLGALASIMVVWVMTALLVYEAVNRLITPVRSAAFDVRWLSGKVGAPLSHTSRLALACPCRRLWTARSCSSSQAWAWS